MLSARPCVWPGLPLPSVCPSFSSCFACQPTSRTKTTKQQIHRDYLTDRPAPEASFDRSVFIRQELERIAAGKPMEPLDETRYACNKPAPKLQGDLQAWRTALNNLRAQQEHHGNRCV